MPQLFNALIRTHHITSRKKVAHIKAATKRLNVHAILRSGGVPGIMYVEGHSRGSVADWVDVVHGLRYKDYQLVVSTVEIRVDNNSGQGQEKGELGREMMMGELREVETVKEMGAVMERMRLREWWRVGMGFAKGE